MAAEKEIDISVIPQPGTDPGGNLSHRVRPVESTLPPISGERVRFTEKDPVDETLKRQAEAFSAVLHDVNNQITILAAHIDVLEVERIADPEDIASSKIALKNIGAIVKATISRLRTFTLIDEPVFAQIMLSEFLARATSATVINTRIKISTGIHTFYGDTGLLERVFFNLLDNARKYGLAEKNGVEIVVTDEDGFLVFSIKDSGNGLTADPEKIFHFFYQGHYRSKGFGIGLAFCKKVVEMHSGSVSAQNNVSSPGACFTIKIPLNPRST